MRDCFVGLPQLPPLTPFVPYPLRGAENNHPEITPQTVTAPERNPSWCAYPRNNTPSGQQPNNTPPLHYCCWLGPLLCTVSFCCYVLCLLVVLAKLSVLAKWLARKTTVRKHNRGEVIVFRKPRPKSEFLGLYIMCLSFLTYMIYLPNAMAWCSLFVLKVPLNTKQTNKPPCSAVWLRRLITSVIQVNCNCNWNGKITEKCD